MKRARGIWCRPDRSISLAQPLSARTPFPPHRAGHAAFHGPLRRRLRGRRAPSGRISVRRGHVADAAHIGTHIDALCHAWYDDRLYNGFPGPARAAPPVRPVAGSTRWGRSRPAACCWTSSRVRGGPLPDGAAIGVDDLGAARSAGGEPGAGDVVLIRTGWAERQTASFVRR